MIRSHDLYLHAWSLLTDERGFAKPVSEADVRRSISAAYYSLFHKLADDGAAHAMSSRDVALHFRVRRAFDHGQMKKACLAVRDWKPGGFGWSGLFLDGPDPRLRTVASSFIELQDARHLADYDLASEIPLAVATNLLHTTTVALMLWEELQDSPDAAIFMTALLLADRLNRYG